MTSITDRWIAALTGNAPDTALQVKGVAGAQPLAVTAPVSNDPVVTYALVNTAPSTWTTIIAWDPPAGNRYEIDMIACDIADILDLRYRVRVQIGLSGSEVMLYNETISTNSQSAFYPRFRIPDGQRILVQAFHAETLAKDISATVVGRKLD